MTQNIETDEMEHYTCVYLLPLTRSIRRLAWSFNAEKSFHICNLTRQTRQQYLSVKIIWKRNAGRQNMLITNGLARNSWTKKKNDWAPSNFTSGPTETTCPADKSITESGIQSCMLTKRLRFYPWSPNEKCRAIRKDPHVDRLHGRLCLTPGPSCQFCHELAL
jgi:hypothetical protein